VRGKSSLQVPKTPENEKKNALMRKNGHVTSLTLRKKDKNRIPTTTPREIERHPTLT